MVVGEVILRRQRKWGVRQCFKIKVPRGANKREELKFLFNDPGRLMVPPSSSVIQEEIVKTFSFLFNSPFHSVMNVITVSVFFFSYTSFMNFCLKTLDLPVNGY